MKKRLPLLVKLAALGFIVFLALIIIWADRGAMPDIFARLYSFPGGDLVGHFLLMGCLALLANAALSPRTVRLGRVQVPLGSLLAAAAVTLEEASQMFFPTRSASLLDLAASYLGILIFGSMTFLLNRVDR